MVGELLGALDKAKLSSNTLVIFTSDNGGMLNQGGQDAWKLGHRLNGDLQGFKFGAWEGGHRVPLIARWPGKIPAASECTHLISQVDFLATFATLTKVPLAESERFDSIDQAACFLSDPTEPLRKDLLLIPNSPRHLGIREGDWVYLPLQDSGGFQGKQPGGSQFAGYAAFPFAGKSHSDLKDGKLLADAPKDQLYNLASDPGQEKNIVREHPEKQAALSKRLEDYRKLIPETKKIGWIQIETLD